MYIKESILSKESFIAPRKQFYVCYPTFTISSRDRTSKLQIITKTIIRFRFEQYIFVCFHRTIRECVKHVKYDFPGNYNFASSGFNSNRLCSHLGKKHLKFKRNDNENPQNTNNFNLLIIIIIVNNTLNDNGDLHYENYHWST